MKAPDPHAAPGSHRTVDRRRAERYEFGGEVTVSFENLELKGPGRNISTSGVYFTAAARPRVKVMVEGRDEPVDAELVRFETLADGKVGLAVRFLDGNQGRG